MAIDSDNPLKTSSLVNEEYLAECIQLRQRVRELEQQNRLLTLLLAEQLFNSSTNSVNDNQSKLDKLMAINSLSNNLPQLISEYESTILDNNSNHHLHGEVSIMKSSCSGQGQITMISESKGITTTATSESDYCGSMGNNHLFNNNNNNHHDDEDEDDETECSDRLVSMSKCNSMLGVNLTHVNIDRWRKIEDDKLKTKTTTTTTTTSQPNLPTNQLTSHSILPLTVKSTTISETINLEPVLPCSIESVSFSDYQKKSSYINNLVHNNLKLFSPSHPPPPTATTTTNTTTTTTTTTSLPSSLDLFTATTITNTIPTSLCNNNKPGTSVSTTTLTSTLTSTLVGSPSSSLSLSPPPPQPPIHDTSLFQSSNNVNCSSSSTTTNQLEKRILFILASNTNSNNNKCFNSTFSSSSSSSTSSSSSFSTDKINCDNRLINKPGNLALRTLSGSSIKSIVSLDKDSPASSATSFDSNGECTSKDEGYSTMSSDVQSDIGNNNNISNNNNGSIVTINTNLSSSSSTTNTNTHTNTSTTTSSTTTNQNEPTIHSKLDDKESVTLNSQPLPPPRATLQSPPLTASSSPSSLSTLIHLKQHQQLKGETIEIKSEPKKSGVNGSPTNSIPLTFMSTVNPIVVGSSRLTTFKSSHQTDCLATTTTINSKNNKMKLVYEEDADSLIGETIKLNHSNPNDSITMETIKNSSSTMTSDDNLVLNGNVNVKSSNWLNNNEDIRKENGENNLLQQSVNCCKQNVNHQDLIRRTRKNTNHLKGKQSTHRYTFPPVATRLVVTSGNTLESIDWTPCLIYQPFKPTSDHHLVIDNLMFINENNQHLPDYESQLITTAEKSTSANFENDNYEDETRCLVNNREVISCEDKRKRSGKNHHHHHMGKVEDDGNHHHHNQQHLDGKTNELNQVKSESGISDWRSKIGRRKGLSSKGDSTTGDSGSLMMVKRVTRNTGKDEDDEEEDDEEEEEKEEDKMKVNFKINQKRKIKVHHKFTPGPGSSSSSNGSQSLNRWHSDSQLYSDSMMKDKTNERLPINRSSNQQSNYRSPRRRRDIISNLHHHPSQSGSSPCKRSSGYIRRRIKREDRARIDESHRWSTLSTSSSALSDGLEAPIHCEHRRYRPNLPMTITTTNVHGSTVTGNLSQPTETGTCMRYISSDENHSADDEDSAERFVSRWLHKSSGGLRWDDSEVTWKLNESLDWPEPIELESNENCLSSSTSSPSSSSSSSSSSGGKNLLDTNQIINHLNNDDTFEEIPLIDDDGDDSCESRKIEIKSTINSSHSIRNNYSVLISPCDDGEPGGGCDEIDVSHEGGGEGYISSDQASSVPDDGLTPETHFNGDFYRLCSVGSRTSLQQPDDEISLPPLSSGALSSLSSSSSPPLTDVKEQDEDDNQEDDDPVNCPVNETKIVLRQLTNSNDQDNYDELLEITTTTTTTVTSINSNNLNHQLQQSTEPFDQDRQQKTLSTKSQSIRLTDLSLPVVKNDQSFNCKPIDLHENHEISIESMSRMINSLQSSQCLSSSSPDKSVKFGQSTINPCKQTTSSTTINTDLIGKSEPIDCKETIEKKDKQLSKPIITVEQSIYRNNNNNGHQVIKDNCPIYKEISQSSITKPSPPPPPPTINCYPKPILIKSSSTNQAKLSPTRIPLPKQSNSLDAIKTNNNKDGFKLRFNSPPTTTATTIDSITSTNNVNNLITKSFINQHQVKRLNNNKMIDPEGLRLTTTTINSPSSSSSLINKKCGTELKSFNKMMMEIKAKMEKNNNQLNHNRLFNRKLNESIPSIDEFERRLSEDKQMADKIREFYSLFEQSTTQLNPPTLKTTLTTIPSSSTINSLSTATTSTSTTPSAPPLTSLKGVKSNQRSRATLSGEKIINNIEDIKSKLNYPKLLRCKGIGGMGNGSIGSGSCVGGGSNSGNNGGGNDSGKTMKEGHETSWVHVSGFNVGKICEPPAPPSSSSLSSISAITSTTSITTPINCIPSLNNSGKLSSDSGSSEDEFNLSSIKGNNLGKKRSSFHQRLLALHRSRRQKKRASDCYMGMGFLPKIRASIVDRLDFYHRFGDKEQEALTSFNFLNDLPSSSLSSSSTTTTTTTTINTHTAHTKSPTSTPTIGSADCNFVQEQQLLLRFYLNSFEPLTTSSSSSSLSTDLSPIHTPATPSTSILQPSTQPPPSASSSSSSPSFKLSPYKWPQSPVKSTSSSSSSPRYQPSVTNNYILNHELTKRPVGGVS